MKYLYIYIKNEEADDILKYGIKLSEHANKILNYSNIQKSGILSYLAPKDCELYNNKNYSCLKVSTKNIKGLIYNNICENLTNFDEFICSFSEYNYGDYEEPLAIITSTILPENISLYNKYIDTPLIIQNSKEYFYEKSIYNLIDTNLFSNYELYQILLILAEQKKILTSKTENNVKLYKDNINGKTYTKRSNS